MPTYEYACLSCKRHFEVVQRLSDEPLRTCEVCGGPLRRGFPAVGILLKGSGFSSTDNRGGRVRSPAEPKGEEKKSAESSSTPSTSTESKPAKEEKKSSKPSKDASGS